MYLFQKQTKKSIFFLTFFFVLLGASIGAIFGFHTSNKTSQSPATIYTATAPHSTVDVSTMVGQLFMVGLPHATLNDSSKNFLKDYKIGGILLLSKNIESPLQIRTLVQDVQKVAKDNSLPYLLIAADQEGGIVSRIPLEENSSSQKTISSVTDAYITARTRGEMLHDLGISVNFSPVVDTTQNPQSFLFSRTFKGSPSDIAQLSSAMISGYRDSGIIASPKHFPGHGETELNPHFSTTAIPLSDNTFAKDFSAFHSVIAQSYPDMIMVGHSIFPSYDTVPASRSKIITSRLLRDTFNFRGVVITDDMEMSGAYADTTLSQAVIESLNAGADMIILSGFWQSQDVHKKIISDVINAVNNNKISQERIVDAYEKILALKERFK